ncbi:hypothetical protein Taro_002185 [Colocasia esculenta]|uniref:Core-2/I-branching beta-1,6-N-acetylglucosaminyltransferase family protein n=1 Tax=Colocasia esculenta TaxID=4460 RepID=A0A843TMZ0_COLES|nr:hypothetical protein [Colocasia esculenta]
MHSRVTLPEDVKDPLQKSQSRAFPLRILKFLVLFLALGVGFLLVSMSMTRYFGVESLVSATRINWQPCIEELGSLSQWIRPPSNLLHSMSDKELFWRASFIPQVKKYPFKRVPKISFMFLTKGPLPLYPLWEKFLEGHEGLYSIYVHSLPSYQADFPPPSPFYRRQVPSQINKADVSKKNTTQLYGEKNKVNTSLHLQEKAQALARQNNNSASSSEGQEGPKSSLHEEHEEQQITPGEMPEVIFIGEAQGGEGPSG